MSHWTTVKTTIKSLTHLAAAAKDLGLKLEVGTKEKPVTAIGYNGNRRQCIAKIVGSATQHNWRYDIALDKENDGTYAMTTDWYDNKAQIVGERFNKLNQLYSLKAMTGYCNAKTWTAEKRILKDGTIQLVVKGM